jgi:hypothetical protein
MASPARRVPDWLVERLAAGELPEAQARELRAALRAAGEEDRLSALAASHAEILASLPPGEVVTEIERRALAGERRVPARRVRPLLTLSFAATCAAGLAVFLSVREHGGPEPRTPPPGLGAENIEIKGLAPSLRVYRKTRSGSELLRADAVVRKGDNLQVRYVAAAKRFGVIASVDARGAVTLHLPESPGVAVALDHHGERALPHAYELDDSPDFERFIFVTSDRPFATTEVVQYLTGGRALPTPLSVFALTLTKETP